MLNELQPKTSHLSSLGGFGTSDNRASRPLGNGLDLSSTNGSIWSAPSSNHSSKPQSPFSFANEDPQDGTMVSKPSALAPQKQVVDSWSSWYPPDANAEESSTGVKPFGQSNVVSSRTASSAWALGAHRQFDKLGIGRTAITLGSNAFKLPDDFKSPWSNVCPSNISRKYAQDDHLVPSTGGAIRNGGLGQRYGDGIGPYTNERDPFTGFTSNPSFDNELMARPATSRHNSDQGLGLGTSRFSLAAQDESKPSSALASRRPSAFGTHPLPSPNGITQSQPEPHSFWSDDTLATNSSMQNRADYASYKSTNGFSKLHANSFPAAFTNPQVAPFYPTQYSAPPDAYHGSMTSNFQSDTPPSLYARGPSQLQASLGSFFDASSVNQLPHSSPMDQMNQNHRYNSYPQQGLPSYAAPPLSQNAQLQQMQHLHSLQMQIPMQHPFMYPVLLNSMVPIPHVTNYPPLSKPELPASPTPTPHPTSNTDYMSRKVHEFQKTCKTRKWEVSELFGHLVELSGDQAGSRFLQVVIANASSQEKTRIFEEILPNALPLMKDVFGNYVIQKFFEYGDQNQKRRLGALLRGQVAKFSVNTYGCRVVQKAFEHILADQQSELVCELNRDGIVLQCIEDQHGNHVIQKAIEVVPSSVIGFIYNELMERVPALADHNFGCRVVQRMLEQPNMSIRIQVLAQLRPVGERLITSTYGNYVAQHIISHGDAEHRQWMKDLVFKDIRGYGQDKFASNVVEVCIKEGTDEERRFILNEVMRSENGKDESDTGMVQFVRCQYGNYVVQKFIEFLGGDARKVFLNQLENVLTTHRRLISKRILDEIENKIHRPGARTSKLQDPRVHSREDSRMIESCLRSGADNTIISVPVKPIVSINTAIVETGKVVTPPPSTDESISSNTLPLSGSAVGAATVLA